MKLTDSHYKSAQRYYHQPGLYVDKKRFLDSCEWLSCSKLLYFLSSDFPIEIQILKDKF